MQAQCQVREWGEREERGGGRGLKDTPDPPVGTPVSPPYLDRRSPASRPPRPARPPPRGERTLRSPTRALESQAPAL